MNSIHNFSEIAPLKTVLMHRPGKEFANLTPNTLQRLLFDDIPDLPLAEKEHDAFAKAFRDVMGRSPRDFRKNKGARMEHFALRKAEQPV